MTNQMQAQDELLLERQKTIDGLLEACKGAMREIDNHIAANPVGKTYWPDISAKLNKAIAKAGGRG